MLELQFTRKNNIMLVTLILRAMISSGFCRVPQVSVCFCLTGVFKSVFEVYICPFVIETCQVSCSFRRTTFGLVKHSMQAWSARSIISCDSCHTCVTSCHTHPTHIPHTSHTHPALPPVLLKDWTLFGHLWVFRFEIRER